MNAFERRFNTKHLKHTFDQIWGEQH